MTKSELLKRLYRSDFRSFVSFAFAEVFPNKKLLHSWHIDLFVANMISCLEGKSTRRIINAPPRTLKSFVASIAYPVFALAHDPGLRIIIVAGNRKLAKDLDGAVRLLMRTPRFLELFPHLRFDTRQQNIQTAAGGQLSFSVYGKPVIGRGADIIIVDDPYAPSVASNDALREEANWWFATDLLTRLNSRSTGVAVVVMQRLHRDDLTGMLLKVRGQWEQTCLPAIATEDELWVMPGGHKKLRRKGGLLQPAVLTKDGLLDILYEVGAVAFSAQFQQETFLRNEYRSGYFYSKYYDADYRKNWKPGDPMEETFMGSVSEIRFIQYELFGVGERPPARYDDWRTFEEWSEAVFLHQQRLLASVRGDDLRREERRGSEAQ